MTGRLQKQVNPKVAAALLLIVLVAVQWAWWRGLVYRGPQLPPGGGGGPGGPGPSYVTVRGRQDIMVDTLSGDLQPGKEDGPGYAARFDRPTGLAVTPDGILYVADTGNHRIRKILPDGETTTLAGSAAGYADGPALEARFNAPCGVAVTPDGVLYVADTGNHCIRKIENGQVTTLIGKPPESGESAPPSSSDMALPASIAYVPGASPYLLVAEAGQKRVSRYRLDGSLLGQQALPGAPTSAAAPMAVAMPQSGTLLLGSRTFRNIPFEEATAPPNDPNPLTLRNPVAVHPIGQDWLATDTNHAAVFLIRDGRSQVLAGDCSSGMPMRGSRDGNGEQALFGVLSGIAVDSKGHAYVADTANNNIRRLTLFSTDTP